MASKNLWKIGLPLVLLGSFADPSAAQEAFTCPASCPTQDSYPFTTLQLTNAYTDLVFGATGPGEDDARGLNLYELTLNAEQAAFAAEARAAKCPVIIRYWTQGHFLLRDAAKARFFGDIQTSFFGPFGLILDMRRVAGEGPPLGPGDHDEIHEIQVSRALAAGNKLTIQAVVGAHAEATGSTNTDQASAHFKMWNGGENGGPWLHICRP